MKRKITLSRRASPEAEKPDKGHFTAIISATVAALLTFMASVVTSFMNNNNQISLEERKFESNLILKAIELGDVNESSQMLNFYIESGLISDKAGSIKSAIESKNIPIFNRDGQSYRKEFIDKLFSEWNKSTDLTDEFKIILVSVADNIVKHRWHALATDFDPEYYAEQLSLLSSGSGAIDMDERTIMKVMKQYVKEALLAGDSVAGGVGYDTLNAFDFDDVVQVYFLDIVTDRRVEDYPVIKFRLVLKNGQSITTGYWFKRDTFYFYGAYG